MVPLNDLPLDAWILTIISAPAGNDLANIREQGLKIGGQRIARAMQVPDHLVQIITKPDQLCVNKAIDVALLIVLQRELAFPIKQKRTPEMNRTHPNGLGASLDALKLACSETEIELLTSWFRFLWPSHVRLPWQSACVLGFGDHQPVPNENRLP